VQVGRPVVVKVVRRIPVRVARRRPLRVVRRSRATVVCRIPVKVVRRSPTAASGSPVSCGVEMRRKAIQHSELAAAARRPRIPAGTAGALRDGVDTVRTRAVAVEADRIRASADRSRAVAVGVVRIREVVAAAERSLEIAVAERSPAVAVAGGRSHGVVVEGGRSPAAAVEDGRVPAAPTPVCRTLRKSLRPQRVPCRSYCRTGLSRVSQFSAKHLRPGPSTVAPPRARVSSRVSSLGALEL
jgi:hypothetical protein